MIRRVVSGKYLATPILSHPVGLRSDGVFTLKKGPDTNKVYLHFFYGSEYVKGIKSQDYNFMFFIISARKIPFTGTLVITKYGSGWDFKTTGKYHVIRRPGAKMQVVNYLGDLMTKLKRSTDDQ